ncbi:lysophospholipase Plb3 [Magnaporthiopsis poae ATCC 64411]|uniref:Lysophospholipase n=1 Tax=Magnaporthiopsis poae (strain ATCC 64411 / 73-15) TaxID=644358 RepID=A0A0C4E3K4_MAGP6|nr:lysophospholipase Plb3 [Magnaporthiopsis poae ATCC 64411]
MMRFIIFAAVAAATAIPPAAWAPQVEAELAERALPNSPSGGYAPQVVDCPQDRPKIRSAGSGLSPQESKWLEQRRKLRASPHVWKFDRSLLEGPDSNSSDSAVSRVLEPVAYWGDILKQVSAKRKAGFDTSLTDYWGRALAYQLIDAPDGGPAYTFSSIAQSDSFKSANTPLPFIVADGRAPGTRIINLNSTVFEFSPFELGTWDPTAYGFAPLEYLGSNFSAGVVPTDGGSDGANKCVRGFDAASFVMGTSSSLFNQFLLRNITSAGSGIPQVVLAALREVATRVGDENDDIASYRPNPFLGYNSDGGAGSLAGSVQLSLVDGGSDGQNIPLQPLIQPARRVDVVFAVDSSADTKYNWPDGFALRVTYDRSLGRIANGTVFPAVPDQATFLARGLNNRPVFFGCDVANLTSSSSSSPSSSSQPVPPLIVYMPNAPYTAMPNVSTFTPKYGLAQRDDIILNGYNMATQGNGTLDAEWSACVACAVLQRSLVRTGTAVPAQCSNCFSRYCWDGKLVDSGGSSNGGATTNPDMYQPAFRVGDQKASGEAAKSASVSALRVGDRGLAGCMFAVALLAALA